MNIGRRRGSESSSSGLDSTAGHWLGCVQVFAFSSPNMRRFRPAGTWFVLPPVSTGTQFHGCGVSFGWPGTASTC